MIKRIRFLSSTEHRVWSEPPLIHTGKRSEDVARPQKVDERAVPVH